ncbi:hypothetical protein BgiMline_036080, partial [Biomphalaria glabrata]
DAFVWKKEHKIYRNPLPDARNLMEIPCKKFWQDLTETSTLETNAGNPLLYILATDAFVWKREHKIYRNPLPDARNLMEIPCKKFWQDLTETSTLETNAGNPLLYILATDAFVWKKEHKIYRNPLPDARNLMEIPCKKFWQDLTETSTLETNAGNPLLYILASSFSN